ncbi:MAG: hypothetical protein WC471_04770 [Candidatus Woesearchaeota archaeon]
MVKKQKVIFKIVDYDEVTDDIETYDGLEQAADDDIISGAEEGFMLGYMEA